MKVFDLMHQLAKMPAGADVKIKLLMPQHDVIRDGVEETFDGVEHYGITKDVLELDNTITGATVFLYSD